MEKETYLSVVKYLKEIIIGSIFEGHVYTVGGCVRDFISKREIKDIDIVVDIKNGGIKLSNWLFENDMLSHKPVVYENFGTTMFNLKKFPDIEIEAVHTRKECYRDSKSRKPETSFGTIKDDAFRRDFTYNALYYNVSTEKIFDLNGFGLDDLNSNILRTCGNPDIIYKEDPLRIIRGIRFSCRFNSTIEQDTFCGMKRNVERLNIISKERISSELDKILISENASYGIKLLFDVGAIKYIVPEYEFLDDNSKLKLISDIEYGKKCEYLIKMSIFMSFSKNPKEQLIKLKYSNSVIKDVVFILNTLQFFENQCFNDEFIRRIEYICRTKKMYSLVTRTYTCISRKTTINEEFLGEKCLFEQWADENFYGDIMFGYELPVNGNDIMNILNIGPSHKIKEVLDFLTYTAIKYPSTTKEEFIKIIKIYGKIYY